MTGAVRAAEHAGEMILCMTAAYRTAVQTTAAYERMKAYWEEKVNVSYHTKDRRFDRYMQWVSFQPILRRIYGCSFLPHHDYGKGGRGWRDLWQDCLALLLMNPNGVGEMLLNNFQGVRIDGTNATIIGSREGTFIADRNQITRVWMDHGVWPFVTTKLYIDQTGDLAILEEEIPYFKDQQAGRGESVAFTNAYAGNLRELAELLELYAKENGKHFMKLFKSSCGVSPSEYRRNMGLTGGKD